MVGKILKVNEVSKFINELKEKNRTIILAGGSFDILHGGHIEFLKNAKKLGDILIVLLESDARIKKLKGENRPVNSQKDRTVVLANLPFVSYVLPLKELKTDKDYEILVKRLKPDIIATSGEDLVFDWEKRLEKKGLFRIIKVMDRKPNHSTSNLVKKLDNLRKIL